MPHQKNAVDAMSRYFELDKYRENRNGLVVISIGSGKTYTAVNWLLSEGVAKGYKIFMHSLRHRKFESRLNFVVPLVIQLPMEFRINRLLIRQESTSIQLVDLKSLLNGDCIKKVIERR